MLEKAIPIGLGIAFIGGCLLVLWAIVRFSIASSIRTRGASARLRKPELAELERRWSISLPKTLGEFYQAAAAVVASEVFLAPPRADPTQRWYIENFIPLSLRDTAEWIKITGVPGIPLAIDGSKGTYYLPFEALRGGGSIPVMHRAPGLGSEDNVVASSVEEFVAYVPGPYHHEL